MPTQLTQPTGSQLVPLAPSGAVTTLGTLTATQIDAIVAADVDSNPVREAWTHIDGLVGRALTTVTYPFAYRAMIAACRYELLAYDRANQEGIPNAQGGGILIDAYNDKMARYASQVGVELRQLGIYSSNYYVFLQATAERIGGATEILILNENGTDC